MIEIFVNLKRFDVPRSLGGICPLDNPERWINDVISDTVNSGLGRTQNVSLIYLLPESLIITANNCRKRFAEDLTHNLHIGCQGVFRENIVKGGNFGAFTTNLPALAAKNLGCTWSIIGHSEERKDTFDLISGFRPEDSSKINGYVNEVVNKEVMCALSSDINVLLCVGETVEERGNGTFDEQKPHIERVIRSQLEIGLQGGGKYLDSRAIAIGYEPRWAIGPGKTPPNTQYIGYISEFIKETVTELYTFNPAVVYGGGLKEENAAEIVGIKSIDGGLVALTRFTGEIGFDVEGLKKIVEKCLQQTGSEAK
jgi:triosephosphate isomerase (TIM)